MTKQVHKAALFASARTPFLESAGAYSELMSYELAALAIQGIMDKNLLSNDQIDQVVMGTVLHEINTTNVAREAMLKAGLLPSTPAYTVAMAGISPNLAAMNLCNEVSLGRIKFGIAGGTENFSDVPIRLSQTIRRSLMKVRQTKNTSARLKILSQLRPKDLKLDIPESADFTTKLNMGQACEAMAKKWGADRHRSDQIAANSHRFAIQAAQGGFYKEQIIPINLGNECINSDNSPRQETNLEKLSQLKPIFDQENGVITAGNSSRFTDGAGAMLIGSHKQGESMGINALALFKDYLITGVDDLYSEMLLGPALTIPQLLKRHKLSFKDIGVWEIHEAFATQLLINLNCMATSSFVKAKFGSQYPHGEIPLDKLNIHGGSLALGNPFAATGVRLIHTAAQRLREENQQYAIVSTCAGGGLGAAILLENPN